MNIFIYVIKNNLEIILSKCSYQRLHKVAADEGTTVEIYDGVSVEDCRNECYKMRGCNNCRYFEDTLIATCILMNGKVNEIVDQTDVHGKCYTNYRVCDTHGTYK